MSIYETAKSRTATFAVAFLTAVSAIGCGATMPRGAITAAGAALGATVAAGAVNQGRWQPAAVVGGGIVGAVVASQFEPDCIERTTTVTTARTNGSVTGQSAGSSTVKTDCIRDGNVTPGSIQNPTMTPRATGGYRFGF